MIRVANNKVEEIVDENIKVVKMKGIKAYDTQKWDELVRYIMNYEGLSYEKAVEYAKNMYKNMNPDVKDFMVDTKNSRNEEKDIPDYLSYIEYLGNNSAIQLGSAVKIVNKWLCRALDKNDGEMVRNACIVLQTLERKAYTDSLDISVTEDNGVYKVEAKSSYNNYEDSKVCYISKKSDGNLYVKFHEFSGLDGHLEGDSDYWGLNFALGAPSWMITSQEHEWDNVISKIVNKL